MTERLDVGSRIDAEIRRRSVKPDEFFSLVEMASPGQYLEVFGWRNRSWWTASGYEVVAQG
jgi:N6-adenosine-specific RNA methylase IME4